MHVAFVAPFLPAHAERGVLMHTWAMLKALTRAGHRVTLCAIRPPNESPDEACTEQRRISDLHELGVGVELLRHPRAKKLSPWRRRFETVRRVSHRALRARVELFYPMASASEGVARLIGGLQPDVVVVYKLEALSATRGLRNVPRIALFIDLPHLMAKYRRAHVRWTTRSLLWLLAAPTIRHEIACMTELLQPCEGIVNFAAHHAQWLTRRGLACRYLRVPLDDQTAGRRAWQGARQASGSRPRILLPGHLKATAALRGLRLFAGETLPILERALGPTGFEVHLVGAGTPPADLARRLARPSIVQRGFLAGGIAEELLSAHLLLVPTPIKYGMHTRIIEGFAYGCCVVAHNATALAIPDMVHEDNVLLAANGRELADAILRALRDEALRRRLGQRARETYEERFSVETAGARFVEAVEQLSGVRPEMVGVN